MAVTQSRIESDVDLSSARASHDLNFSDTRVAGSFDATSLRSETSLRLDNADIGQWLSFSFAKVDGYIDISGASIGGNLYAWDLQLGGPLLASPSSQRRTLLKNVNLRGASIGGNVGLDGATVDGDINANALRSAGSVFMRSTERYMARFKTIDLTRANITGHVEIDGAMLDGVVIADSLRVEGSWFMRDATAGGFVAMPFAKITGNLDLRGSTLADVDLSGASVAGDLRLGSVIWLTADKQPGRLTLRNTRIGNLMDTRQAWPQQTYLHIQGFAFSQLGGFEGDTGSDMRGRGMVWWDEWARLDPVHTPGAYEQLAAALVASGHRDAADEIRFLGRARQREHEQGASWVVATFLQYVAGYGIGDYTFRVIIWVALISIGGAIYLWWSVPAAHAKGPTWCFGASLNRLLPVIEINKEFSDFFNDPERKRLTGTQSFVFSAIGLVGWLMGAILIAAVSGLTQNH